MLEAFAKARPQLPRGSLLLIAGTGSREAELSEMARGLRIADGVRFLGYVDSIPQVIQAADVHVLSSDFEGLPAVILEAMALGVPTISTAVDGIQDLIVAGEGVLVPPRNSAALASALEEAARDRTRLQLMGAAAQDRFRAAYTESRMVERTRELYQKLLGAA
jgi:glycosyltransferase involved in cell wall biosynthesis